MKKVLLLSTIALMTSSAFAQLGNLSTAETLARLQSEYAKVKAENEALVAKNDSLKADYDKFKKNRNIFIGTTAVGTAAAATTFVIAGSKKNKIDIEEGKFVSLKKEMEELKKQKKDPTGEVAKIKENLPVDRKVLVEKEVKLVNEFAKQKNKAGYYTYTPNGELTPEEWVVVNRDTRNDEFTIYVAYTEKGTVVVSLVDKSEAALEVSESTSELTKVLNIVYKKGKTLNKDNATGSILVDLKDVPEKWQGNADLAAYLNNQLDSDGITVEVTDEGSTQKKIALTYTEPELSTGQVIKQLKSELSAAVTKIKKKSVELVGDDKYSEKVLLSGVDGLTDESAIRGKFADYRDGDYESQGYAIVYTVANNTDAAKITVSRIKTTVERKRAVQEQLKEALKNVADAGSEVTIDAKDFSSSWTDVSDVLKVLKAVSGADQYNITMGSIADKKYKIEKK